MFAHEVEAIALHQVSDPWCEFARLPLVSEDDAAVNEGAQTFLLKLKAQIHLIEIHEKIFIHSHPAPYRFPCQQQERTVNTEHLLPLLRPLCEGGRLPCEARKPFCIDASAGGTLLPGLRVEFDAPDSPRVRV